MGANCGGDGWRALGEQQITTSSNVFSLPFSRVTSLLTILGFAFVLFSNVLGLERYQVYQSLVLDSETCRELPRVVYAAS